MYVCHGQCCCGRGISIAPPTRFDDVVLCGFDIELETHHSALVGEFSDVDSEEGVVGWKERDAIAEEGDDVVVFLLEDMIGMA
mmetsp:Transcript_26990/g.43878  ORF Transcript_26990/g.43878 Transcript_26990/m.43878 type:complete len:83 (+) Transcript_26990:540-788(+)